MQYTTGQIRRPIESAYTQGGYFPKTVISYAGNEIDRSFELTVFDIYSKSTAFVGEQRGSAA
jgi:hypothetical protein